MKKIIFTLLFAIGIISSFQFMSSAASAHEILPKNVVEFIQSNPDASPDEIKQYIADEAPEFSDKVQSDQAIIDVVNQDTSFFDNAFDFMKLGVEHILDGPDHILFVLSLLLVFISFKTILKYTSTFTVAHSITLILAGSGALVLSSQIVEPIIALSIAVVAISTVFFAGNKYLGKERAKLGIIFFFGLFHGLGFAGLLEEIAVPDDKFLSSLISFNIGVEIGQLIIVALALPFIYLLKDKSWYPTAVKVFALLIASIAVFWFFERIISNF
jgi:hypothetical protein